MSDPIVLEVEISLPRKEVAKNARAHHHAVADAVSAHRLEAKVKGTQARVKAGLGQPAFAQIVVTAVWYMAPVKKDGRYRPTDGVNAQEALKAAIDGLVDAGFVYDDVGDLVRQEPPILMRYPVEHEGRCGIVLQIEGSGEVTHAMRRLFEERLKARALSEATKALRKKGIRAPRRGGLFDALGVKR